jgi:aspartate aminotransferase
MPQNFMSIWQLVKIMQTMGSIMIANRMKVVKASPTLYLTQKAQEMKAQGIDIIALSAGEPDFSTPIWICDAAIKAMDGGHTKYTAVGGTPQLKSAIINKFKQDQGLDYAPSEVMASTGGKQVIFNAMMSTINDCDQVIIPAPYWVSYVDMILLGGGEPVIVDCTMDSNFKLSAADLEKAITAKTKWLFLNSPSNPTGMVYNKSELRAIADVLLRNPHVYIMSDDIYEYLVYDSEFFNILEIEPSLKNRTLIVNGVSKAYSMTGWRLGYGAGPKELIKAMTDLQSHSTSNPCSITQAAAVAAINGPRDFLIERNLIFKNRRDKAIEILSQNKDLKIAKPDGAFYLYVCCDDLMGRSFDGHIIDSDASLAEYLLNKAGVAVVHGEAFGLSNYFRISYALDDSSLEDACQRIVRALM